MRGHRGELLRKPCAWRGYLRLSVSGRRRLFDVEIEAGAQNAIGRGIRGSSDTQLLGRIDERCTHLDQERADIVGRSELRGCRLRE